MPVRALAVLVAVLALSGCIGSLNDSVAPPVPPEQPAPPVVGHWLLDAPAGDEPQTLWIEADGTYTAMSSAALSIDSISFLSSGTWDFSRPTLTTHDAKNGDRSYFVTFGTDGGLLLRRTSTGQSWSFHPEQLDAGP
jgi:hypothetical protein